MKSPTRQDHHQTVGGEFASDTLRTEVWVALQLVVPIHIDQHLGGGLAVIDLLQALPELPRLGEE